MKFEFFISKRYLLRGRENSFISIISLASIIGIAIGVAALIIALSLISGFQHDIRNKILGSTAHVMINSIIGDGLEGYEKVIEEIKAETEEIKSASPVVFGTVLIKGSSRNSSGAILRGVDLESKTDDIWSEKLRSGKLPLKRNELIIGADLASRLNLMEGDSCIVITPQPILSPSGIMPKIKKLKISGIFKSGLYEVDNGTIITNLRAAQKLFGLKNKISYIQIYLNDLFESEEVAEKLRKTLPVQLSVITWKDLNATLYLALEMEKTVIFFTLNLIIIVASLNIIAGLILLVIQKIRDIGILLSYGATPKMIKRIFFLQGGVIGIIGTTAGFIIGLVFCYIANTYELIKVPSEIYQMTHIHFRTNFWDLLFIFTAAMVISFTATLIPSKKASSINVVDAVKSE